jgi:hypothetical protein
MKRAFMVMPFSDDIVRQAYEHCVKDVFKRKGIEIRKADEIFSTNPVYDDIVQEIQNAQIIVVDISGKNTNVFYELGIAHTLKQTQTIILTHDEYKEMPFDIAHFRIIHYDNTIEGNSRLKEMLNKTIDYILADYATIFRDEYETVMNTLTYAGEYGSLFALVGLRHIGGVIKKGEPLHTEGHIKSHPSYASTSYSAESVFKVFKSMDYVKTEGGSIYLTDKGTGFVDHLKISGYVCDVINDHIITEGYAPFIDRYGKRRKPENPTGGGVTESQR